MNFFAGLFIGCFVGFFVTIFMQGASVSRREQEIYMEGFVDGQNTPKSTLFKEST